MTQMKCRGRIRKLNRDKTLLTYTINDFYRVYEKKRKDVPSLDKQTYCTSIQKILEYITQDIIETTVPYNPKVGLGRFGIIKRKSSRKKIDFIASKKHNKTIYHTNLHTNGYHFQWYWEKYTTKCNFKNKSYYKFQPGKALKKRLSEHIMKLERDAYSKNYDCLTQLPIYEQA